MDPKYLAQIPIFQKLPEPELKILASKMEQRDISAGEILFREGDVGNFFFIIADGELEVIKALDTKSERLIAIRRQGNFIGELSLINPDGKRTASVRAKTKTILWQLSGKVFEDTLHKSGLLAYKILQELSQRLTNAHEKIIFELQEKNTELTLAYTNLQAAQEELVEKEKLEQELHVAKHIQESILPSVIPKTENINFSCFLKPARAVGGDFYDIFELEKNKIAVMIGDVTDKGVAAALVMAQTHALLYSEAIRGESPEQVLQKANQKILRLNQSGLFITSIYGIVDTQTREFIYARAGHEIPLIKYPKGKAQLAPKNIGQPLGLFEEPILDNQKLKLEKGSRILLYTDGALDLRNPSGEQYQLQKLQEDFSNLKTSSAEEICQSIYANLFSFQGEAEQYDDITFIGIQSSK